jgi:hypothetical protein
MSAVSAVANIASAPAVSMVVPPFVFIGVVAGVVRP